MANANPDLSGCFIGSTTNDELLVYTVSGSTSQSEIIIFAVETDDGDVSREAPNDLGMEGGDVT